MEPVAGGDVTPAPGDHDHRRHATVLGDEQERNSRSDHTALSLRCVRRMTHERAFWFPAFFAVLRHPRLWATAARQAGRAVPRRWWGRPPFLPLPSRPYVQFRLETAFGVHGTPTGDDVVRYLHWCRDAEAVRRSA